MLFNSLSFLLFFPIVLYGYYLLPHRFRWMFLLAASYYFYFSSEPTWFFLIALSTLFDYFAARGMVKFGTKEGKPIKSVRKLFLVGTLIANLSLLFTFKYFNFFGETIASLSTVFAMPVDPLVVSVALPIGISFYTFQTLSYSIDVYRGKIQPEKHPGKYALYVSFFPQLVAGPIERASHLLPQIQSKVTFAYSNVTSGLGLMLWGFFKKVVIADRAALAVDAIYADPTGQNGLALTMATVLFGIQIYCDFSGYSDIAIGAARTLGIDIMQNFKRPYFAANMSDFWRRWHISLSTWFQDYVFNPLYLTIGKIKVLKGLSPKGKHLFAFIASLVIGEALLGLWHGAAWTFIIFGLYHALWIAVYYLSRKFWDAVPMVLRILCTFVLVQIGWIFFRANSLGDAWYILTNLFSNWTISGITLGGFGYQGFVIVGLSMLLIETVHIIQEYYKDLATVEFPVVLRWAGYIGLSLIILLFGMYNGANFIYFQF